MSAAPGRFSDDDGPTPLLEDPLRQRLLFALGQHPATISQLAVTLAAHKGNVAHHLKMLRAADMVHIVETRQVRGGTEQYYQRSAHRLKLAGNPQAPTAAMLGAAAEEIAAADDEPLLTLRHLRLTADQAEQLRATLADLVGNVTDAGDDEPRYGMLVGLYRQAAPDLGGDPRGSA
jgi:DNA-binding transcriptional ArsR family regulator